MLPPSAPMELPEDIRKLAETDTRLASALRGATDAILQADEDGTLMPFRTTYWIALAAYGAVVGIDEGRIDDPRFYKES